MSSAAAGFVVAAEVVAVVAPYSYTYGPPLRLRLGLAISLMRLTSKSQTGS